MKAADIEGFYYPGDVVHWTDPDDGLCSRDIKIKTITSKGNMVVITDVHGDTLECFPWELS